MRPCRVIRSSHTDALITVEGFTDPAGSIAFNKRLGQKRADAIRDYLVSSGGLSAQQVRAVSYGEDSNRQVHPGAVGEAGRGNRRVVLVAYAGPASPATAARESCSSAAGAPPHCPLRHCAAGNALFRHAAAVPDLIAARPAAIPPERDVLALRHHQLPAELGRRQAGVGGFAGPSLADPFSCRSRWRAVRGVADAGAKISVARRRADSSGIRSATGGSL
ncbi:OmpA family protein [Pseudoxanthomonas wuyuanensis]|uniref:OmpA family protein n=1 Tax=Pseudoxanthomonas wuyuanensis TaxID=1073196 RepID=UPI002368B751|nr:OmpA family protein [Pseudoxanthomonas wuyuanensis]